MAHNEQLAQTVRIKLPAEALEAAKPIKGAQAAFKGRRSSP